MLEASRPSAVKINFFPIGKDVFLDQIPGVIAVKIGLEFRLPHLCRYRVAGCAKDMLILHHHILDLIQLFDGTCQILFHTGRNFLHGNTFGQ